MLYLTLLSIPAVHAQVTRDENALLRLATSSGNVAAGAILLAIRPVFELAEADLAALNAFNISPEDTASFIVDMRTKYGEQLTLPLLAFIEQKLSVDPCEKPDSASVKTHLWFRHDALIKTQDILTRKSGLLGFFKPSQLEKESDVVAKNQAFN